MLEGEASWVQRLAGVCQEALFGVDSSDIMFNPYRAEDPVLDSPGAAGIRRSNLLGYLASFEEPPPVLVLAEAPGPWGCRFSGVPITSEEQLMDPGFPFSGSSSGRRAAPYSEYSAGIFWRVMRGYVPRFFVWNAVPMHPHRPGEPLTIRTPTAAELRSFGWVTERVVEVLRPEVVVALGRKAEFQLGHLGLEPVYVRHPSQGGAILFERGMRSVFGSPA